MRFFCFRFYAVFFLVPLVLLCFAFDHVLVVLGPVARWRSRMTPPSEGERAPRAGSAVARRAARPLPWW